MATSPGVWSQSPALECGPQVFAPRSWCGFSPAFLALGSAALLLSRAPLPEGSGMGEGRRPQKDQWTSFTMSEHFALTAPEVEDPRPPPPGGPPRLTRRPLGQRTRYPCARVSSKRVGPPLASCPEGGPGGSQVADLHPSLLEETPKPQKGPSASVYAKFRAGIK